MTEVRVLYEIAHPPTATASELCKELGLDPGYLSRILAKFEKRGLVSKAASAADGRQSLLSLTARGQKTFAALDSRQNEEVAAMLRPLLSAGQSRLVQAMHTIKRRSAAAPNPVA